MLYVFAVITFLKIIRVVLIQWSERYDSPFPDNFASSLLREEFLENVFREGGSTEYVEILGNRQLSTVEAFC